MYWNRHNVSCLEALLNNWQTHKLETHILTWDVKDYSGSDVSELLKSIPIV